MQSGSKPKPILIVQGGQYGSEAKGAITGWLALNRHVDWAVRTGAVNAGHTVYYNGSPYVNQQLPVAWVNRDTMLCLGPGTMIEPDTLWRELAMIGRAMNYSVPELMERVFIDYRCGVHSPEHAERSAAADRHHKIGATGKGCSEAIIDKIRRRGDPDYILFRDHDLCDNTPLKHRLFDVPGLLNRAYDTGKQIMLEGTQGAGLDLHLGPYPYTTHKPCNAAQWVVESGLSPSLDYEVVLVMRTFPIRVAGNSGPMFQETTWPDLAVTLNNKRTNADMPVIVDGGVLWDFEVKRSALAREQKLPHQGNFTLYSPDERVTHKAAISELDKQALELMSEDDIKELRKLFEMTTVTRKLRRIGMWDPNLAQAAIQWNRPSWCALTFCNYLEPTLWGWDGKTDCPDEAAFSRLTDTITEFEEDLGGQVPIRLISFGPDPSQICERMTAEEFVSQ